MIIFCDTGPLGAIVNPKPKSADVFAQQLWARRAVAVGHSLVVPTIADYEVRRELLRAGKTASVVRLDAFIAEVPGRYLPLEDAALKIAAQEWARVRNVGGATAHPHALDGDVILAGQVLEQGLDPADYIVVTDNVGHLARFVRAGTWRNIAL